VPRSRLNRVLALLLRYKRGYRVLDRIFMIRILSVLAPILRLHRHRYMPDFIQRQAMGLDTVLK
jgi:tRNA nucleotidyltransferase/poly(A) polymerase